MLLLKLQTQIFIAAVIILLVCATEFAQRRGVTQIKEQVSFGSESEIKNAVKIPQNVLEQLAKYDDGRVQQCQGDNFLRQTNAAKHFAATRINLNADKRADLIVQAQTSCFMGAHNTTFWIFTQIGQKPLPGHDLVFTIAADFMDVLKTSTNGYRDIETASHTAIELSTTVWKFDGSNYQPRSCKTADFKTNQVTRVKCQNQN